MEGVEGKCLDMGDEANDSIKGDCEGGVIVVVGPDDHGDSARNALAND